MQQPPQQQTTVVSSGGVIVSSPGNPPIGYATTVQPIAVAPSNIAESYKFRQSVGLGATLIVIGILSMIFNAVGLGVNDYLSVAGHGFWIGALYIITGGFGVGARNKNRCMIVTFMILCIFSAIFTIVHLGMGIGGAVNNCSGYNNYYYPYRSYYCNNAGVAMESLQAILAVAAAIVSIWGSAICCNAVCCCTTYPATYGMVATPYGNQQVTIITQQQQPYGVQYPAAPYMTSASGFYQPPIPQQQTWIAAAPNQQPLQPGIHGSMQQGAYPSAPVYTSYGAQGFNAPMAPPSYAVSEAQKNQVSGGSHM